jgi:hypothetical protein
VTKIRIHDCTVHNDQTRPCPFWAVRGRWRSIDVVGEHIEALVPAAVDVLERSVVERKTASFMLELTAQLLARIFGI